MASAIHVLAGPPGAGKSSVGGAMLHALGLDYFDPEAFAALAHQERWRSDRDAGALPANCASSLELGWRESVRRLQLAIVQDHAYAFETTLCGRTIPALLALAAERGMRVRVWYYGVSDPDLLVYRALRRSGHGGWPREETRVRESWRSSLAGLIYLLPHLDGLRLLDNSAARPPAGQVVPAPVELLRWGCATPAWSLPDAAGIPAWARPVFEAVAVLGEQDRANNLAPAA